MILLLNIYRPNIVVGAVDDVFYREHGGIHGVILIVVLVHSVSPYGVDIGHVLG